MDLQAPVKNAGNIFKMYASRLEKLGITTFEDFLYHIPSRYEDFSLISKIRHIQPGEVVTIQGKVDEIKNVFTKNYKKIQQATISDETGNIDIMWFNQVYLPKVIHKGDTLSVSGRVEKNKNHLTFFSPEYEIIYPNQPTLHTGRFVPVYPETKGVSSKWLRRQVYKIIQENKKNMIEYFIKYTY